MFAAITARYNKLKSMLPPLKEVLSEDGIGSYSRYTGFIVVLATVGWVTFIVIHNHAFPDMAGPSSFMATGQAQYVANQVKRIAAAAKSGEVTPQLPAAPVSSEDTTT
jgi:hypothetical protein